jgi:lysyl-tRNA synthetase class 2
VALVVGRGPSQIVSEPAGQRVELVGRVLEDGRVADAFFAVPVSPELGTLAPGVWVRLVGIWDGSGLSQARLLESWPGKPGASDFERLRAGVAENLRARARAKNVIRGYFEEQGFLEVDTPVVVPGPGTDRYIEPFQTARGFLSPSPEFQMKRLVSGGLSRVYQLSPVLRAEELGPLHQPEFMLCEWYRAFEAYESVQADTEALVRRVTLALRGESRIPSTRGHEIETSGPFERITVREAFRRFAGVGDAAQLARDDEDRYFQTLVDAVEPALSRFERPVFLVEYPRTQAALARACPGDADVAERFELYLDGVELCNGYGELVDPLEQRARFEADLRIRAERGQQPIPIDERFLGSLADGMPLTSGNALGFDRLLLVILGAQNLGEVQAFPEEWL